MEKQLEINRTACMSAALFSALDYSALSQVRFCRAFRGFLLSYNPLSLHWQIVPHMLLEQFFHFFGHRLSDNADAVVVNI